MTENEKLRALLAEAQFYMVEGGFVADHPVVKRIDAALAEPVADLTTTIHLLIDERDEARAEVARLTDVLLSKHGGEPLALLDELDEARAEVERLRFSLKRAATSLEIVCSKWTRPAFERGEHLPMIRADYRHILEVLGRALPIPEDEP